MMASVSVYSSAAEAVKGIQLLELMDLGQMMKLMMAFDPTVADQVDIHMGQELDLTAVCDLGTGSTLSMVTPFMQLDMAICICSRGRTTTGLMAMGPQNKILEADLVALLTTMDERIRSDPTLLVDVEGHDRLTLDSAETPAFFVADSAEGIALDMILPQSTDLPGSRISSESWDRLDEHPHYQRSFEGRGFNFSLGESELAFLDATVTLFESVPQALEPVAEAAIESEAGLAQLFDDAGEFTEFLTFLEGTEMEPIEGLNLGIHSTGVLGRIRGAMRVDVFLVSFAVGRLNVELMAMAAPESARVEDFITLATHVRDRLLIEAPMMSDLHADVETIEAIEQLVRVNSDVRRLSRTGELDSALLVLAEIDTATTVMPIDGSMWNSLCWYGSLWGYVDQVLPACEAAIAVDSTNWAWRDSRGLALALTGDLQGAVSDFEFAVNESTGTSFRRQRNEWIEELRAGNNPFTAELLEELRRPSG
jgi:hypothetical protein